MHAMLHIPKLSQSGFGSGRVGLFDSGLGGLAVVRELLRLRPELPICYVADQIHAPYGPRPAAEVRRLCEGISLRLLHEGCEPVVLACHTASAAALYSLREKHADHRFVGLEPAVKPACQKTRTGEIGVLATSGTLAGKPYAGVVERYANGARIHTLDCREFVELVESGSSDGDQARSTISGLVLPFLEGKNIDQLVLACTHYAFLKTLIQQTVGPGIEVIDPCEAVARQALRVVDEVNPDLRTSQNFPVQVFVTTGDRARFAQAVQDLLGMDDVTILQGEWA